MLFSSGRRDESSSIIERMLATSSPRWGVARKAIAHVRCERKRMPHCVAREDSDFSRAWSSAAGRGNASGVIVPA